MATQHRTGEQSGNRPMTEQGQKQDWKRKRKQSGKCPDSGDTEYFQRY